jgi:hypothetical protein
MPSFPPGRAFGAHRLDGLEPVARQAACRAAIIGREVPVDQLAGLMGWDHADTVRHVNTLVAVGLLEDADGGRLRLVHELARRAVGSQLVAVERVNPHREIRSFLTQRIDTPDGASTLDERTMADVARHAYEGQDWSDAVRHGTVVARAVLSRWSAATAAAQLDRVVDAAERGHIELGADVHVLRARARRLVGELVGARDDLAMAVTVADAARDPAASWQARYELALLNGQQSLERAAASLDDALVVAHRWGYPAAVARTLNRLGNTATNQLDLERARRLLEEAMRLAVEADDDTVIAECGVLSMVAYSVQGDFVSARRYGSPRSIVSVGSTIRSVSCRRCSRCR